LLEAEVLRFEPEFARASQQPAVVGSAVVPEAGLEAGDVVDDPHRADEPDVRPGGKNWEIAAASEGEAVDRPKLIERDGFAEKISRAATLGHHAPQRRPVQG
jgi:hypothetical protein